MSQTLYCQYVKERKDLSRAKVRQYYRDIQQGIAYLSAPGLTIHNFGTFRFDPMSGKTVFRMSKMLKAYYNGRDQRRPFNVRPLVDHLVSLSYDRVEAKEMALYFLDCILANTMDILGTRAIKKVPKKKFRYTYTIQGFGTFYSMITAPGTVPQQFGVGLPLQYPASKGLRFKSRY